MISEGKRERDREREKKKSAEASGDYIKQQERGQAATCRRNPVRTGY